MNKIFLSKFGVLALAVSIFGYLVPSVFAAAPLGTLTGTAQTIMCGATSTALTGAPTVAASGAEITVANDIRIRIQSTTNATWDVTKTTLSFGGNASGSVSTTVTYPGADSKTLLINVTTAFTTGQTLTVNGLFIVGGNCIGFGSTSAKPLQWAVDGSIYATGNANTAITVTKVLSTSTTISNQAPVWTVNATDSGPANATPSNSTTPTNVGATTTWAATAQDANADPFYLLICNVAGATPHSGAVPTCNTGTTWATSGPTVGESAATAVTATRPAVIGDAQVNAWFAYVCDANASSPACSAASGAGVDSTPFNVNHAPVIGTVTDGNTFGTNSTVTPGNAGTGGAGSVFFRIGVTDSDTDSVQDTISYYICAAAGFAGGVCSGGATVGSGSGVVTGTNADNSANLLVPIPTTHETTAPFFIYLKDSHNLADGGNGGSYSWSVTDVASVVGTYTVNDINPSAGSSTVTSFTVVVSDNNGGGDVTSVNGFIYDSTAVTGSDYNGGTGVCTPAEKTCYSRPLCTLGAPSGTNVTATCDAITTQYNINPTSAPSTWKAHVNALSHLPTVIGAASATNIVVASLSAVAVGETTIGYNATVAGAESSAVTTTLANAGNVVIDVGIHGNTMTSGGNTILPVWQHWASSAGFTWGVSDWPMLTAETVDGAHGAADGCSNASIPVRTAVITPNDVLRYWKIKIPATQQAGTYLGNNTFTSVVDGQCTGTD